MSTYYNTTTNTINADRADAIKKAVDTAFEKKYPSALQQSHFYTAQMIGQAVLEIIHNEKSYDEANARIAEVCECTNSTFFAPNTREIIVYCSWTGFAAVFRLFKGMVAMSILPEEDVSYLVENSLEDMSRFAYDDVSPFGLMLMDEMAEKKENRSKKSICLRDMPDFVMTMLKGAGIPLDVMMRFKLYLKRFGTDSFGKAGTLEDAESLYLYGTCNTEMFIPFAAEELDALIDLSEKYMSGCSSPADVDAIDFKAFSKDLERMTQRVPLPLDVILFGRDTGEAGIKNCAACLHTRIECVNAVQC